MNGAESRVRSIADLSEYRAVHEQGGGRLDANAAQVKSSAGRQQDVATRAGTTELEAGELEASTGKEASLQGELSELRQVGKLGLQKQPPPWQELVFCDHEC